MSFDPKKATPNELILYNLILSLGDSIVFRASGSGDDFSVTEKKIKDTLVGYKRGININIPTASATSRGLLSSTDWSTFNTGVASIGYNIVNLSFSDSPYTILPISGMYYYLVDTSGGSVNILFPSAISNTALYGIKKIDSANTIVLTPNGVETIDGGSSQTIRFENTEVDVFSDNINLLLK